MFSFSYRNFKEYLSKPLEKIEVKFLIRTFSRSAIFFFLFGLLIVAVDSILKIVWTNYFSRYFVLTLIGFISNFPLNFFARKFSNQPVRLPNTFVVTLFVLLTVSFLCLFLGITGFFAWVFGFGNDNQKFVLFAILLVFLVTFLVYLIPVGIAFFITNRKVIVSISKFLNFCYFAYLFVFLATLIIGFVWGGVGSFWRVISFLLVTSILFLSPIVTVYNMKTTVPYINYEDQNEVRKWENYFVFEIVFQLLRLAFFVMRMFVYIFPRSHYSRLR